MMPSELNQDRFAYLFDLALEESDGSDVQLSTAEREEVRSIRLLLDAVDSAWQVPEDENERMHALLLQKLARSHPNHPWLRGDVVHTLGELVQAGDAEVLHRLPGDTYQALSEDSTPVELLHDPAQRTVVVGQAIRAAQVPQTLIADFIRWLNRAISNLVAKPGQPGLTYARRQGERRGRK